MHSEPIAYLERNWQGTALPKIAKFGTDQTFHLWNTTTSRAEGAHHILKQALQVSTGDLKFVIDQIGMVLQRHTVKRKMLYNNARTKVDPVYRTSSLFRSLSGIISHVAVKKMAKQLSAVQPEMTPCTGSFIRVSGLPCKHFLHRRLREQGNYARLLPSEFHKHWFFDVNSNPARPPILQVQDPDIVERRRTRRRGLAQSSTQRGLTTAEVEDQRLNQKRHIQIHDIPRSRIQQQQTPDHQQQLQLTPPRQTPTVRKTPIPSPVKPKPK